MPVQHVPFERVKKTIRELGVASQKKIDDLTNRIYTQEQKISELRQTINHLMEILECNWHTEEMTCKTCEEKRAETASECEAVLQPEKDKNDTEMRKTRKQIVQNMNRCPSISVWARLTHPHNPAAKDPAREQRALPYAIRNERIVELEDQKYPLNHAFGQNALTIDILTKLDPFLRAVRAESRRLILIIYGGSGSGKSSTLFDSVATSTGRNPALLELIAEYFFAAETQTGNAATFAKVAGYHCAGPEARRLSYATTGDFWGKRMGETLNSSGLRYPSSVGIRELAECRSTRDVFRVISAHNRVRVQSAMFTNLQSPRDHYWYHIRFSRGSAPKGAVTIFNLAGLEDLCVGDAKDPSGEGESLINTLNALQTHLSHLDGGGRKKPNLSEHVKPGPNLSIRSIADMLLVDNKYSEYRRPFIVVLGHVADTNGQQEKSRGWIWRPMLRLGWRPRRMERQGQADAVSQLQLTTHLNYYRTYKISLDMSSSICRSRSVESAPENRG
ncbi:hypothetical protein SVAN01_04940 [Stagonosporopsis vannaccii]|nr:hypothetical protein SVAN01_04940 [Stagonosporopsis vannaccii]